MLYRNASNQVVRRAATLAGFEVRHVHAVYGCHKSTETVWVVECEPYIDMLDLSHENASLRLSDLLRRDQHLGVNELFVINTKKNKLVIRFSSFLIDRLAHAIPDDDLSWLL